MRKKIIIMVSVIALVSMFMIGTASADDQWYYSVNLVKADVGMGGIVFTLADDAGTILLQKYGDSTIEKSLLAVALTAQSLGVKVHALHDTSTDNIAGLVLSTE